MTVMEAAPTVGGLAGSLTVDGIPVEKYYHFICRGDHELVKFVSELGLSDKLAWKDAGTSCYIRGRMYPFNSPFDLMRFAAIPLVDRVRFGLHVMASRYRSGWEDLDRVTAKKWLIEKVGSKAYAAIWDPLLRIKFGAFQDHVSAAWIWHRIRRVAESREAFFGMNSYGYLEQGCATLLDGILACLKDSGRFRLELGARVDSVSTENGRIVGLVDSSDRGFVPADAVVSTVAIPEFLRMVPSLGQFSERLASIEYLNIACVLFQVDRPFTSSFWLNVNDPHIPINGIIETTNLNARQDLGNTHLLYVPYYLHHADPRWAYSDSEFYEECVTALRTIRSDFRTEWIRNWWVSRDRHAQAICSTGFLDLMPGYDTPVNGLFLTDSSQYYPEDRTVSASVRLGREVAEAVSQALASSR